MYSGLPGGAAERPDCFFCMKKSQNAAYLAFLLPKFIFGITFLALNEGNQLRYHMSTEKSNTAEEVNQAYSITAGSFPKRTHYCIL